MENALDVPRPVQDANYSQFRVCRLIEEPLLCFTDRFGKTVSRFKTIPRDVTNNVNYIEAGLVRFCESKARSRNAPIEDDRGGGDARRFLFFLFGAEVADEVGDLMRGDGGLGEGVGEETARRSPCRARGRKS